MGSATTIRIVSTYAAVKTSATAPVAILALVPWKMLLHIGNAYLVLAALLPLPVAVSVLAMAPLAMQYIKT